MTPDFWQGYICGVGSVPLICLIYYLIRNWDAPSDGYS